MAKAAIPFDKKFDRLVIVKTQFGGYYVQELHTNPNAFNEILSAATTLKECFDFIDRCFT